MRNVVIAIDGPAGAGKSTVAQILAQRLNYNYIDTGAMYRAIAWKVFSKQLDITNTQAINEMIKETCISLVYRNGKTTVLVDDCNVSEAIRSPEISVLVPKIAQIKEVRDAMLQLQRKMAENESVVMDGRDIGTHVLPKANVKIFLTASIEERANRRWKELTEKGFSIKLDELKLEIANRDKADSERTIAPLKKAEDAILVDTTGLSIEKAVESIINIVRRENALV